MTCDALPAVGVFVAAAIPNSSARAFHSGAASPGLYSGFFYSVCSHQKAKTRCANSGLSNQN